jgi:hypothetical protein
MGRAHCFLRPPDKKDNNMKSILFLLVVAGLMLVQAQAQAPQHVQGWPYVTYSEGGLSSSASRFGFDQGELHLYFDARRGEADKFELNGSFSTGWPIIFDSLIFGEAPIILDIDHDAKNEMAVKGFVPRDGRLRPSIYLLDDNGNIMSGFPVLLNQSSSMCAADMDADNEYEFMIYDFDDDLLYCIDRYGNPKPGWPVEFDLPTLPHSIMAGPAIGDLDLDGKNEYIIATFRYIYAFRYDGSIQEGFPIVLQEDTTYAYWNGSHPPILADVDQDAFLEIVYSGDNYDLQAPRSFIVIYNHDGTIKDGWPKYLEDEIINCPVCPSDINGDGFLELGFQKSESLIYVDMNLNPLPGWPSQPVSPEGLEGGSYSDLAVVDVNGDNAMEIFFDHNVFYPDSMGQDSIEYFGHSYQFGLDHLGQPLAGFPFRIRGFAWGQPPAFALDPISSLLYMTISPNIFLISTYSDTTYVELYRFSDSTGAPNQWPMLSHDNLLTRNYNFVDRVTSVADESSPPLPKSAILKQNYPNPFNSTTQIEYILPKEEQVTLSLYDILGRKIKNVDKGVYPAGNRQISLDMGQYTSGVYYLVLSTPNTQITRKLVLLK